jgi:phage terminase small subunit
VPKLTAKQDRFCREYLTDLNATQAAIRAGYSPKTANQQASRLLAKVKVQDRIAELQKTVADRLDLSAERVLRELALLGFANMADFITTQDDGSAYVDLSSLTREQAAAIAEVTVDEYTEGRGEDARAVKRTRFRLSDKRAALVDLGRHLGLFNRDQQEGQQFILTIREVGPE